MTQDTGFITYIIEEVLQQIPGLTTRSMFGGYGIYQYGIIFAIIVDDQLYFKVDDTNRKEFEEYHSTAFTYEMSGKPKSMSYYIVPPEVLEDRELIVKWVEKAVIVSKNSKKKKK